MIAEIADSQYRNHFAEGVHLCALRLFFMSEERLCLSMRSL